MDSTLILKCMCVLLASFSQKVTGYYMFSGNITWTDANRKCNIKGTTLFSDSKNIRCQNLTSQYLRKRLWLEPHNTFSWMKPQGCFDSPSSSSTMSSSIGDCLSRCKTQHIGYNVGNCYCFRNIPKRRVNFNMCKCREPNECRNVFVFSAERINVTKGRNYDCVSVTCTENFAELKTADCNTKKEVLCASDDIKSIFGLSNQGDAESTCYSSSSLLMSDPVSICQKLIDVRCTTRVHEELWTGIKGYWHMYFKDKMETMFDIPALVNCSYMICYNNEQTVIVNNTNCGEQLDGYICKNDNKIDEDEYTRKVSIRLQRRNQADNSVQRIRFEIPSLSDCKKRTKTTINTPKLPVQTHTPKVKHKSTSMTFTTFLIRSTSGRANNQENNTGTIAGIVVGVLGTIAVVIVAVIFLYRRSKNGMSSTSKSQHISIPKTQNGEYNNVQEETLKTCAVNLYFDNSIHNTCDVKSSPEKAQENLNNYNYKNESLSNSTGSELKRVSKNGLETSSDSTRITVRKDNKAIKMNDKQKPIVIAKTYDDRNENSSDAEILSPSNEEDSSDFIDVDKN